MVELEGRTQRKRRTILAAATELFLRNGFLGTSMDEVAALAGVSKQTVYKQFASKEALFIGIVDTMTSEASARVEVGTHVPTDAGQLDVELRALADRLMTVALAPQLLQLRRLVIGEAARFPQLGKSLYDGGPGRAIASMASMFALWTEAGLVDIADPVQAATQFNWLIMGEPVNRAMFYGSDKQMNRSERESHIASGVRVFLAAYSIPQPGIGTHD